MSDKSNKNQGDQPDLPIPNPADFFGWLNRMMTIPTQAAAAAIPQTPPNPADPLEMWKSVMDRNEQMWSSFMRQITATPEFAQSLGRGASTQAAYRTMIKKTAKAYLEAADMPTREDVSQLAKQIVALDAKVDDMGEQVEDNAADASNLNERILTSLENLAKRMEQLEARLPGREEFSSITQRLTALEGQLTRLEASTHPASPSLDPASAKNSDEDNPGEATPPAKAPAKRSRKTKNVEPDS
jgi:polyhydroxyalkanoic acid synthase PhaR subunit